MIEQATTSAEFDALRQPWEELFARAATSNLFLSHTWLANWIEHFGGDRWLVLVRWEAGLGGSRALRAAAIFVESPGGWSFIEEDHSYYPGVLHEPADLAPLGPFLAHLRAAGARTVALIESPAGGSFCGGVQRALGLRCAGVRPTEDHCDHQAPDCEHLRRVRLDGWLPVARYPHELHRVAVEGGYADYLSRQPAKLRHELKRKRRRLERELPGVAVQCFDQARHGEQAMAAIEAVELDSWKERQGTAVISNPVERSFYRRVFELYVDRKAGRVYVLADGGGPLAYALCVRSGDTVYALKTSYRHAFARFAPGIALFLRVIEALCDEPGVRRLEFLGSDARWKRELATDSVALCTYELRRASPTALLFTVAYNHMRPLAIELRARFERYRRRVEGDPRLRRMWQFVGGGGGAPAPPQPPRPSKMGCQGKTWSHGGGTGGSEVGRRRGS